MKVARGYGYSASIGFRPKLVVILGTGNSAYNYHIYSIDDGYTYGGGTDNTYGWGTGKITYLSINITDTGFNTVANSGNGTNMMTAYLTNCYYWACGY